MSGIEILLLIVGAIVLTAGYLLPMKNRESDKHVTAGQEKKITELVGKAVEDAKGRIEDIVDETVSYSMEKTERTMERISNEKIMAIHEYSDTVLAEINKNHEEEVFLYDMLNSKHDSLVETVSEAGKTVAEVRQTLQDAQITANEVKEAAKSREFVPMKPDASAEPERVIPSFSSKGSPDDPNVQLEEIIKKSIKTGKKKKATVPEKEVQKEEKGAYEELQAEDTESDDMTGEVSEDFGYSPEEEAELLEYGANRMSPDIQLNKGPALGGNNNEHILEMHRAGKSNMAIAKELGLGIGEVKLVIDLNKGMGK